MDNDDNYIVSNNYTMADDYYGQDGSPFDGYVVTSTNPGYLLLIATAGLSCFCIFLGVIMRCRKKKKEKEQGTPFYMEKIYTRYSEESSNSKKRDKGMELLDLDHSEMYLSNFIGNPEVEHIEKVNYTNMFTRNRQGSIPNRKRQLRHLLSKRNLAARGSLSKSGKGSLSKSVSSSTIESTSRREMDQTKQQKHDALYILELKQKKTKEDTDDVSVAASRVSLSTPTKASFSSKGSTGGGNANDYEKMNDSPVEQTETDKSTQDRNVQEEVKSMHELACP